VEWPSEEPLAPEYVAAVYNDCREIIDGEVILPPVGPWNTEIGYGWIEYFSRMVGACESVDAFALHTYSRGPSPQSIHSQDKMDPPYDSLYNGFQTYRDWMAAIPPRYKELPVYLTEVDQNEPWADVNSGWVKEAYAEIDAWNQNNKQQIWCMCLYRWPNYDQYVIEGKRGVIEDFKEAIAQGYKWKEDDVATVVFSDGFENGFPAYEGEGELMVARGWTPAWLEDESSDTILNRPEFKPAGAAQVHTGAGAQAIHSSYSTVDGAMKKVFAVVPGNKYQVSVWGMGITGSGSQPKMGMIVGVDQGETTGYSGKADVESEWWSQDVAGWRNDVWKQLVTPGFVATYSKITVYLRFVTNFAIPANAHFDDFQIVLVEGGVEPPPSDLAAQLISIADEQLALSERIRDLAAQVGGGNADAVSLIEEAEARLQEAKAIL
jgi:hypothetical protein